MVGTSVERARTPTAPPLATSRAGRIAPDRRLQLDRVAGTVLVAAALIMLGLRLDVSNGVTVGLLFGLATAPLWLARLKDYRGARLLMVGGVVTVVSGVLLAQLGSSKHRVSIGNQVSDVAMILTILVGVGLFLWARHLMTGGMAALWFGLGLLLNVDSSGDLYASNPWRFGYSVAITVIATALVQFTRSRVLEVVALLAFAGIAAVTDARSTFGILLLAAVAVGWQLLPRSRSKRSSAVSLVVMGTLLALVVYNLGQALILEGVFGQSTQARSQAQIDAAGSLLLGGRPELAATWSLFHVNPLGYGAGAIPVIGDVRTAQEGMQAIGYDAENNYVTRFMFGGRFELHSTLGDIWVLFGVIGIAFLILILVLIVRGTAVMMSTGTAGAVLLFAVVKTLWNVAFSPLGTSVPMLVLALGLALLPRVVASADALSPPSPLLHNPAIRR